MFIDQGTTTNLHSFRSAMLRANYDRKSDEFYEDANRHRTPKGVPNV